MQTNELNSDLLRRLAELRPEGARVLSLFLNLDPSEFATPPARATEARSLIDQAERQLRDAGDLGHDAEKALRQDIERARDYLNRLSPDGAHAIALFACGPADLFEAIRLPRPVETRAVIDATPFVEPLVEMASPGHWMVVLVNRQTGRMLRGDRNHLSELQVIFDEVHGQHQQGGWSQARYQRSVDEDVQDHLRNVAEAVFVRFKRRSFDHLLIGGPVDAVNDFEDKLHQYLRERLAGRFEVDVENTKPDEVRQAAAPAMEKLDREREREALDRLQEGVSKGGRGARPTS